MSLAKTKTKLTAALCMLLIAAVMMTTASYAWFTISTAPEISDMETTVVTNETLEIALAKTGHTDPSESTTADAGNQYTWGNIIDLSAATDWSKLSKEVRPAQLKSDGSAILYPKYDTDGRIKSLDGTLSTGNMANGYGNLTDGDGNIYGYYIDYFMRSNVGGDVALTTAVKRENEGATGLGSWIQSSNTEMQAAMRVAFQEKGAGTITEAKLGAADKDGKVPITCTKVVNLKANTTTWVRMYVYIDGKDITNKSASIEGTSVTGTVNVQFTISGVDKSMPSITEKTT